KSIGVKIKKEGEFIKGEVFEIQIDHRKGDGMQLFNDHRPSNIVVEKREWRN
ncbi:hypothetical protein Tco_1011791, partial [Tanacetum coccineum]